MTVQIKPSRAVGTVAAPPSKSAAHRALICAALAEGISKVTPYCTSKDIRATVSCLKNLGMNIAENENGYTVSKGKTQKGQILNFGESGSTARFLLPIAAALGADITGVGEGRLPERPIGVYTEALPEKGVTVETEGGLPLKVSGLEAAPCRAILIGETKGI